MGVKYFIIEYDRETFLPGETVSGKVCLTIIDKPKEIRAVELTLSGKAKCHWRKLVGKHTISCDGREKYFETRMRLAGDGQAFKLPIGDHQFPFSMALPAPLPPSYSGKYGGISYYGKAKLDLPWALNKSEKKPFIVQNPIDLNKMTELNKPCRYEWSETFCSWCCDGGALTVTIYIPRTGFVCTEAIPITIDVDNGSNIEIYSINIKLKQKIDWKAKSLFETHTKKEKTTMKSRRLARVGAHASRSATEYLELGPDKYPNTGNCGIIKVTYQLSIIMELSGLNNDIKMKTPITIGDTPLGGSLPDPSPMGVGSVPPQPDVPPPAYSEFNPDPVLGFNAAYPPNTGGPYEGAPQANYDAPCPGSVTLPNPGGNAAPYAGAVGARCPGAPARPYSAASEVPYTQGSPQSYPGASDPGATSTPNVGDSHSQPSSAPPPTQSPYPEGSSFAMRTMPNAPAETNPLL